MAFSNLDVKWIEFPKIASYQQQNIGTKQTTLDASGEYTSRCMPVNASGVITQIGFYIRLVTSEGDVDVRVETLNSSGQPSGTLWDTNTDATVSIISGDAETVKWATLTSGASVSPNNWIAIKIRANASSTPNISLHAADTWQAGTPYSVHDTGTPTKDLRDIAVYAKYSDGSIVKSPYGVICGRPLLAVSFDNGSVLGNKFRLPFDAKIKGVWFNAEIEADATVKLFDSDGSTVLASQDVYYGVVRSAGDWYPRWLIFDSDVTLSAHTWYRLGLVSGSATASDLAVIEVPSGYTGLTNCWWIDPDDAYAACYHTEASSGTPTGEGDWTDTTSQVCYIGVIITEISELVAVTAEQFAFIRRYGRRR